MAKYDAATEGRSGDAGVLSDKVRWLVAATAAARAECVNEGSPFLFYPQKLSTAVFPTLLLGKILRG